MTLDIFGHSLDNYTISKIEGVSRVEGHFKIPIREVLTAVKIPTYLFSMVYIFDRRQKDRGIKGDSRSGLKMPGNESPG